MKKWLLVLPAALAASLSYSLCGTPSAWASRAAKAGKSHHAAKHVSAKRPPTGRPARAGAARVTAPQGGGLPDLTPEEMQNVSNGIRRLNDSSDLSDLGNADAARGDWPKASAHYRQALDLWPDSANALYGMGKCADAAGDTAGAITYYRTVIYPRKPVSPGSPADDRYTTNNVVRLMEFVLLLDKGGQKQEALAAYHQAAQLLNYQDADTHGGKPYLKVLLPKFDGSPDALPYTSQHLQAMAHTAICIEQENFGGDADLWQAKEAVRLYPDSPITNFYLGEQLIRGQGKGAKEAYTKAATLGDDKVIAAAQERLKDLP